MDIEANRKEQQEVATAILCAWDKCPESGEFSYAQLDEIGQFAYRLAELVQAVHEYQFNRNPPVAVSQSTQQPVSITEELWAVIKARRPGAYETLQQHGICHVIMTVGTSRTKLEFPYCRDMSHGKPGWSEFDRDLSNPDRPIIVLDGIPETGFKPLPGLRGTT